jgi:Skp family chaperone for outer membrane proteins
MFGSSVRDDDDFDRSFNRHTGMISPPPSDLSEASFQEAIRANLARRSPDSSDDESGDDDLTMAYRHSRVSTSSTASLDIQEKMEAVQKSNDELRKKLKEAEANLQNRMRDHDEDIQHLQFDLEILRQELKDARIKEKEARTNEVRSGSFSPVTLMIVKKTYYTAVEQ